MRGQDDRLGGTSGFLGAIMGLVSQLLDGIVETQERQAAAMERRADADERTVAAIEERNRLEARKINALERIADKLGEGRLSAPSPKSHTARTEVGTDDPVEDGTAERHGEDLHAVATDDLFFQEKDSAEALDIDSLVDAVDDLSVLLDDPAVVAAPVDDLAGLLDAPSPAAAPVDDLSLLLDEVDDLAAQIDDDEPGITGREADGPAAEGTENLADVMTQANPLSDMDDTALVTNDDIDALLASMSASAAEPAPAVPDTKVDSPPQAMRDAPTDAVDDPMDTGNEPPAEETEIVDDVDDLSALLDDLEDAGPPTVEAALAAENLPDPRVDPDAYKTRMISRVIGLREAGLTAAETAEQLNQKGLPPLSGSGQWKIGTIEKIYQFIASSAKQRG
ncbi:MAG: hypothetical protein CSA22_01705 [Deltaproteobacteria bacterium]|nr:MAG: hypothetical protein CSA22_01705 [Deltaproteobacteria bacterium]